MAISKIEQGELREIADLFDRTNETLIWSCLQGCMGEAYANQSRTSAQVVNGDFCFFGGVASERLVKNRPEGYDSDFVIMVPHNEDCEDLIQRFYAGSCKKVTRYAIKKENHVFDRVKLTGFRDSLPKGYTIAKINETLYHRLLQEKWSMDLVSSFADYQDFLQNGVGFVILKDGEPVSGASSYAYYIGGIEIEIDTRSDCRRMGLATAAGAALILYCMDHNLYPSWDAQNTDSVALAEKLGYHLDNAYDAYEVYSFGKYKSPIELMM